MLRFYLSCVLMTLAVSAWKKEMENPKLFGGDMVLTPDQISALKDGKNAFSSIIGGRWPGGVVPYVISYSVGTLGRSAIAAAIADYSRYTCVKFKPRNGEKGYVQFVRGDGCYANVGYNGGKIVISLGKGCEDKGTAIHEMGHAIGFHHEQTRLDRDQYVRINSSNIINGMYYNFALERGINSLGTPYDLRSIMHYSSTAFAKDYRYRTITTVDPSKQHLIDHGDSITDFSATDIKQINLMYGCGSMCADHDNQCSYWGGIGECKMNPMMDWMLINCRASCNQC